jgi:hypothetical protein
MAAEVIWNQLCSCMGRSPEGAHGNDLNRVELAETTTSSSTVSFDACRRCLKSVRHWRRAEPEERTARRWHPRSASQHHRSTVALLTPAAR